MSVGTVDALELRRLMGQWATGVSIVTSTGPRGCTANAVASLSLDPPLVLACLDHGSNTLAAIRATGRFCINVLAAEQQELAHSFARKCAEEEKFGGIAHTLVDDVPVLDGVLAWVLCEREDELPGGDHAIVIGRPLRGDGDDSASPLIFFRSGYRKA
jgi:3-hydroxy-9,10-secoandrosta-1,3,5(10)-triene-9,17-dione monooxygenase reductase component